MNPMGNLREHPSASRKRIQAPRLIAGPYTPPRGKAWRVGQVVQDVIRGEVEICGMSDAPIAWPIARTGLGRPIPIVTGDLVRAIRMESVIAVMHFWGVSRTTVGTLWRRALRVPRYNPGTLVLWSDLSVKLTPEIRSRAWASSARNRAKRKATLKTPAPSKRADARGNSAE